MAAPKGNKFAVGADNGRKCAFDRKQVGLDFIEYVKANPDCYTVPQFATTIGLSSDTLLTWSNEDEDFRRSYIIAKELIGINRLKAALTKDHNGNATLDRAIYMKGEANYNRDVRHHEREEKVFEYGLKKENDSAQGKQLVLKVNYPNDSRDTIQISPETVPTSNPECPK